MMDDAGHRLTRRAATAGIAGLGFLLGTGAGRAQRAWPNRPVRMISAGSPGGSSDIFVRLLENRLRERLGQSVVLENHPGAGGMVAAAFTTRADDGHTFFISNLATNAIGVSLYKTPTFNPKTDLPPVARMCTLTNALAVQGNRGINTVQDLIAHIRANPSKAFFGSSGAGTSSHLSGLLFGQRIGADVTHVPFRGTAANLNALLRGDVLFSIDNLPLYQPSAAAGTVKLLAVSQATRSPFVPDVPSLQEAGVKDFDVFSWFGISAAKGTSQAAIDLLSAEIGAALALPEVEARMREIGAEPAYLAPAQYGAFVAAEIEKWAPIVKASGASAD